MNRVCLVSLERFAEFFFPVGLSLQKSYELNDRGRLF